MNSNLMNNTNNHRHSAKSDTSTDIAVRINCVSGGKNPGT